MGSGRCLPSFLCGFGVWGILSDVPTPSFLPYGFRRGNLELNAGFMTTALLLMYGETLMKLREMLRRGDPFAEDLVAPRHNLSVQKQGISVRHCQHGLTCQGQRANRRLLVG